MIIERMEGKEGKEIVRLIPETEEDVELLRRVEHGETELLQKFGLEPGDLDTRSGFRD